MAKKLHSLTVRLSAEIINVISNKNKVLIKFSLFDGSEEVLTEELADNLAQIFIFSQVLSCYFTYDRNLNSPLQFLDPLKSYLESYREVESFVKSVDFTKIDVSQLYEEYVTIHEPDLRVKRGIYFTPRNVAQFIINSVDTILRDHFRLNGGLYSIKERSIRFIDPALGTGTFLDVLIDFIYQKFQSKHRFSGYDLSEWQFFVVKYLLPSLTGIELLKTPFVIAQLRLSFRLLQTGNKGLELEIINGNALDKTLYETKFSQISGTETIMVITGNPPFSRHSENKSPWISDLLHGIDSSNKSNSNYFLIDGKPLEEKNPKWLNDDYVKFLRLGHWLIDQTGQGIIAFVLSHSIIDNPTFRGLRRELIKGFTDIFILDLHGNARRRETPPTMRIDKNIFDIQQGVCILFLIKEPNKRPPANVYKADLWGTKQEKLEFLRDNNISTVKWERINSFQPWYFFYNIDSVLYKEYSNYWKLTDIFNVYSVGIMTGNDRLTIKSSSKDVLNVIKDLTVLSKDEFESKYSITTRRQWSYEKARRDILNCNFNQNGKTIQKYITPILYRPFDLRYTFYTGRSCGFHERPRKNVMQNMINFGNIALVVSKSSKPSPWRDVLVSKNIVELGVIAMRPGNNAPLFPLYLWDASTKPNKITNFSTTFTDFVSQYLNDNNYSPEMILHYILAILYSNTYRSRYTEFLKIDFPYIPFPASKRIFKSLSLIGKDIKEILLFESSELEKNVIKIESNCQNMKIEKIRFEPPNVIRLNKCLSISNVPIDVFHYYIGSYQVCKKWLKSHKGEEFSPELSSIFNKMVVAIRCIIDLTNRIDQIVLEHGGWEEVFKTKLK